MVGSQPELMGEQIDPEERRELGRQLVALLPRLRSHAMKLTRSAQLIDDLVQETCENALAKLDQFRREGRFDGWVSSILHNIWLKSCRKKRQRDEQELSDPDQIAGVNLEETLLYRDMLAALGADMAPQDFWLMIQIHVYGRTSIELAIEQGTTDGTVRTRVSRAIHALEDAGWTAEGPPA